MIRDISQLKLTPTATGILIAYGAEVLELVRAGGGSITASSLSNADILNLTHVPVLPTEALPLDGTADDDWLTGSDAAELILAGAGNDLVYALAGEDLIRGGAGEDRLYGGAGHDTVEGEDGADLIYGGAGSDDLYGGAGHDSLYGDEGADRLWGGVGNDLLYGGAGDDSLVGDDGNDSLYGGEGADVLTVTAGDNRLYGGADNDLLTGGAGADSLDGGTGADTMSSGLGNDRYVIDDPGDMIAGEIGYSLGGGIDTVEAWIDFTMKSNLEILRLQGTADLNGYGTWAPENMVGNSGRNLLDGSNGNDILNGKAGDDTLIGGIGADLLMGESGADVFLYRSTAESAPGAANRDFINGFVHGEDRIDLSAIDANPNLAGDQAFRFIGAAGFSGKGAASAGELRYYYWGLAGLLVEADVNGDGQADMQIYVNLTSYMLASDFIL